MAITDKLKAIADAIRTKTGKTSELTLSEMPDEILSIQTESDDIPFIFGGINAKLVSEYSETYTLDDTSFEKGISESTSAVTIKATVGNRYTNTTGSPTYAYNDSDIVVVQTITCKVTHAENAIKKAMAIGYNQLYVSTFSKRKTTDTSQRTTRQSFNSNLGVLKYYNTSGVLSRYVANYGFYGVCQAPSIASATANSTYIRVTSPSLNYRVSTSYETAANCKLVTDVIWEWKVRVYAVDPFSTIASSMNAYQDEILLNI